MAETYIKEFQDYLENLATKHVDVHHAPGTVAFARLFSETQINSITTNGSRDVIVIVSDFSGRNVGAVDYLKLAQTCTIYFAALCKTSVTIPEEQARQEAINKSFEVMLQFMARMQADFYADDCSFLKYMAFENMSFNPIPEQPFLENHYGWELVVPFGAKFPAYDTTKWDDV